MKDLNISKKEAGQIISEYMYQYGMETIANRSLARIEDGLLPSGRYVIYACIDLKAYNNMKCARIVGNVIADWSPHGNSATYEALVNSTRDRIPFITGQGNFGHIHFKDSIGFAAERYTECRLSKISNIILDASEIEIVPKDKNYDERREYPIFLPVKLPMILLNGTEGISVAVKAKIPPINLGELSKALLSYLEHSDINLALKFIKGPDYGEGKIISSKEEIRALFNSGQGSIEYECLYLIEKEKGFYKLIINNFCPEFNADSFLVQCEKLIDADIINYARNESGGKYGDRLVIAASSKEILDKYVMPKIRRKINYNFFLLDSDIQDSRKITPKQMNLKDIFEKWVAIRKLTINKKIESEIHFLKIELEKEKGRQIAVNFLDLLFKILKNTKDLKSDLMIKMKLTQLQAEVISSMRVDSLQRLSQAKVDANVLNIEAAIQKSESMLKNINSVMINDIKSMIKEINKENGHLFKRGTIL